MPRAAAACTQRVGQPAGLRRAVMPDHGQPGGAGLRTGVVRAQDSSVRPPDLETGDRRPCRHSPTKMQNGWPEGVGQHEQRLFGILGAVVRLTGPEVERPLPLDEQVLDRRHSGVQVQHLRPRALRPGRRGRVLDLLERQLVLPARVAEAPATPGLSGPAHRRPAARRRPDRRVRTAPDRTPPARAHPPCPPRSPPAPAAYCSPIQSWPSSCQSGADTPPRALCGASRSMCGTDGAVRLRCGAASAPFRIFHPAQPRLAPTGAHMAGARHRLGRMTSQSLPRSTPAAEGVSAAGIDAFLDAAEAAPGHRAAQPDGAAPRPRGRGGLVGAAPPDRCPPALLAEQELHRDGARARRGGGSAALTDTVVDHFPDLAPAAGPSARTITVEHLARMATGHHADTFAAMQQEDPAEPVRAFLGLEPESPPGSVFAYNNGATYTLAADPAGAHRAEPDRLPAAAAVRPAGHRAAVLGRPAADHARSGSPACT